MADKKPSLARLTKRQKISLAVALGVVVIGGGGALGIFASSPSNTSALAHLPAVELRVVSMTPAPGATGVPFRSPIEIHFSTTLAAGTATPVLTPAVPETWHQTAPSVLRFSPSGNYVPSESIRVAIPSGTHGVGSTSGTTLASTFNAHFTVATASTLRLQQLLAELNYLPVAFGLPGAQTGSSTSSPAPTGATNSGETNSGATGTSSTNSGETGIVGNSGAVAPSPTATASSAAMLEQEPTTPSAISLAPLPGSFSWRFANIPNQLAALWSPGQWNVVTQGAVMAFESDHNMAPDGEPGPAVWSALLSAVANRSVTDRPYDYLMATETLPESLYVWSNGQVIYSTRTNSGVAAAPTPLGTWPVYLRYTVTTMRGVNPDGTHYVDPGIPWVSYFHGSDAVHGFVRSSYGFPQSVGCLEIPIANAAKVFPLDPYGTLVTVTTGDLSGELQTTIPPPVDLAPPPASPPAPTPSTTPAGTTTTSN